MRSYKTVDGFTLRIFSTMYLDWGLGIIVYTLPSRTNNLQTPIQVHSAKDAESVYYNPHCIASDCVGFYHEDEQGNEIEEGLPWSDYDWREYLECEADSLIECFVDNWEEHVNEGT